MDPTDWRDNTIDMLHEYMQDKPLRKTFETIEANTGLSYGWIRQFYSRRIPNPGVVNVQTLNIYLKSALAAEGKPQFVNGNAR